MRKKVQEVRLGKLNIQDNIDFERCHHMRKWRGSRPRTNICRIVCFKGKVKLLQNAEKSKNALIYIYEDFCKDTMELRKPPWEQVLNYCRLDKFAYLNYRRLHTLVYLLYVYNFYLNGNTSYEIPDFTCKHKVCGYCKGGGISIYIDNSLNFKIRPDPSIRNKDIESLSAEIVSDKIINRIANVLYRPLNGQIQPFDYFLSNSLQ